MSVNTESNDHQEVGSALVTFYTTTFPKSAPEQAFSVPLNVLPEGLNSLIQSILEIQNQNFDFLYKDEYIGTSLLRFLQRRNISFEEILNIEYTPVLQAKEGSLLPHDDWVASVRSPFYGNGDVLLTGAYDHCVRLWDSEQCVSVGSFHQECVKEVALSPIAPPADLCEAMTKSGLKGRKRTRPFAGGESFQCVSCSKDGSIASWLFNQATSQLELLGWVKAHTDGVDSVHVSSDGKYVASASWDTTVKVFEWEQLLSMDDAHSAQSQKQPLVSLTDHTRPALCCRFSEANGSQQLFSAGLDGKIKCFDVALSELQYEFAGDHPINGISVKPASGSSDLVLAAFTDNRARLYDSRQKETVRTFGGHRQWLYNVCWLWKKEEDASGRLFATCSEDACVRVYDLRSTSTPLLCLDALHTDGVLDVTYVGNSLVASCGKDNKTKSFSVYQDSL